MLRSLAVTAALLAAACASPHRRPVERDAYAQDYALASTKAEGVTKGRSTWGEPVRLRGDRHLLFPFAIESKVELFGLWDADRFDEGGLDSRQKQRIDLESQRDTGASGYSIRWHNAVALDLEEGKQWPVLEERGILSHYWVLEEARGRWGSKKEAGAQHLLFHATVEDTTGDGTLDDRDASRALFVDLEAGAARYVTPPGTRFHAVRFDLVDDAAILFVAEDEDGDGKFETREAPTPWILDLRAGGMATPLIDGDLAKRVGALAGARE